MTQKKMTQKKIVLITALVHVSPSHATEKNQLTIRTDNQQNTDNKKRKNNEREVSSERDDSHSNASYNNRDYVSQTLKTLTKKRTKKEKEEQKYSENDIIRVLLEALEDRGWSKCDNATLKARIKTLMSKKMIQQANKKIAALLPLLTTICQTQKNKLITPNEADWSNQKEGIKNLFRHTIILEDQPRKDLIKQHFTNSSKMKSRLIEWFEIDPKHHGALREVITIVNNKYDKGQDLILAIFNPKNGYPWYTKQWRNRLIESLDETKPEDAKKTIKHLSLTEIQTMDTDGLKETLKQFTDDPQKAE